MFYRATGRDPGCTPYPADIEGYTLTYGYPYFHYQYILTYYCAEVP